MASNSTESNSTTVDLTLSPEQINLVDVVKEEALNLLKEKIISEIDFEKDLINTNSKIIDLYQNKIEKKIKSIW